LDAESTLAVQPPAAAGIARRTASLCYEILILLALFFAAGWLALPLTVPLAAEWSRVVTQLCVLATASVYFGFSWTHGGQTLPMRAWRLRLVAGNGQPVSAKIALLRYIFALAGIALVGLGFLWAFLDRDRQFLHDRLAGTRIVMTEP
jgi:uncharacterized RDD family membrane protein YckC